MIDLKGAIELMQSLHEYTTATSMDAGIRSGKVLDYLRSLQPQEAVDPGSIVPSIEADTWMRAHPMVEIRTTCGWTYRFNGDRIEYKDRSRWIGSCGKETMAKGGPSIRFLIPLTAPTDQPEEWEDSTCSACTHVKIKDAPWEVKEVIGNDFFFKESKVGWGHELLIELGAKFLRQRKTLTAQIQEIFPQADAGQVAAIEKLVRGKG